MPKRQLKGVVVSCKMNKTVIVRVERKKLHSKYKKVYNVHKRYKAHSDMEGLKVGDKVVIEECRPISKEKKWKVVSKV